VSHLPKRETEICLRLKQAREALGLTQQKCSELLGVPKARLANYELCRAPIKSELALLFCQRFVISEKWLATGKSEMRHLLALRSSSEAQRIPPATLFSVAYDEQLAQRAEKTLQSEIPETLFHTEKVELIRHPDPTLFKYALAYLLDEWLKDVPAHEQYFLFQAMGDAGYEYRQQSRDKASANQNSGLPNVTESVKRPDVKPHLPNLLDRLREATKERGKKSALAEYLGVPLASVSQWLSGEREPGGETTLRLLKWVEAAERK